MDSAVYRTANVENSAIQPTHQQTHPQSQLKQETESNRDQSSKKTGRERDSTVRNHSIEMQNPLMIMPVFIN